MIIFSFFMTLNDLKLFLLAHACKLKIGCDVLSVKLCIYVVELLQRFKQTHESSPMQCI